MTDKGYWAKTTYLYHDPRPHGLPHTVSGDESDIISIPETVQSCSIMVKDQELDDRLALSEKKTGLYSTIYGVEVKKDRISEVDIPISLAKCDLEPAWATPHIDLKNVAKHCDIEELHTHDGDTPSVHLHLKCKDSSLDTLNEIGEVIQQASNIGRAFCKSREVMY